MRAASIHAMLVASADAMLATTSRPSRPHSIQRRSMLPAAINTSGAKKAANNAGNEIIRPAVPVGVSSVWAMVVSKPTGSISVVTTEKVASPTATTASHGWLTAAAQAAIEGELMIARSFGG
ncbi:hypothetical protein D3C81_1994130 [compost metagenome]